MRTLLLLCFTVAACKKPAPPPVDMATQMHGTFLEQLRPLPAGFQATNHDGARRDPTALLGHPTVLWFFPAAATSGCTVEGCGYRDLHSDFEALGIEIIGVSFTDIDTNHAWAVDQGFPYEIWHDDDRELALYYGAVLEKGEPYPKRRTRILNAEGKVVVEYNDKIIVGAHPQEVLEDATLLFGQK